MFHSECIFSLNIKVPFYYHSNKRHIFKSSSGTEWSSPDTPKSERLPKYHFDTPDQWNSPAPRQRSRTVGEDYCMSEVTPPAVSSAGQQRAPKLNVYAFEPPLAYIAAKFVLH